MISSEGKAGLYIHVPFCAKRCPYCDFSVVVGRQNETDRYCRAILEEAQALQWSLPIETVYLGGGTPSLLTPAQVVNLVQGLRSRLPIEYEARLHMEANPDDVTRDRLLGYVDAGVQFLSLGVQSLQDSNLSFLGRRHSAEASRRAIEWAKTVGFSTVSGDLIFGWEHQTPASWLADLEDLLGLGVDHISCYQLTFHRETPFGQRFERGELGELANAEQRLFLEKTHEVLDRTGWLAYEVSNFARSLEHRSQHNMKYWNGSPYLGLGPAAHSFRMTERWWNRRAYGEWLQAVEKGESAIANREHLTSSQLLLERLMLALRTTQGFSVTSLEAQFGLALPLEDRQRFEDWAESGYVTWDGDLLKPQLPGMAIADGLAAAIRWPDA